jgi:hypothetical protein
MNRAYIFILLALVIGIAVGYFLGFDHGFERATGGPAPKNGGGVACTMEAKECPDGSFVGRQPPSCEFAPCPGK